MAGDQPATGGASCRPRGPGSCRRGSLMSRLIRPSPVVCVALALCVGAAGVRRAPAPPAMRPPVPDGLLRPAPSRHPPHRPAEPRTPEKPLERVEELLEWLDREQQKDGGWTFKTRLTLAQHVHREVPAGLDVGVRAAAAGRPTVPDTAIAGLALMRAGNTTTRGTRRDHVRAAAEYLYRQVMFSDASTLSVKPSPTPFTARIGTEVDSFLALLFFAELRDPAAVDQRYDAAARKLIDKIQKNQRPDGSWGNDQNRASNAPLLGHALGVWALETASRKGFKVDGSVIVRAGQYALGPVAEKRDRKASGKWKKDGRAPRPDWLVRVGVDDEPVNFEWYSDTARLSVLYQADKSNRWVIEREIERLEGAGASAHLHRLRQSAEPTRRLLEAARAAARQGWIKLHDRDLHPCPGPLLFTGEDFLASLLTVDSMAECKDVEQWFPPVVQRLAVFQDVDGGLRTNQHLTCEVLSDEVTCVCELGGSVARNPANTNDPRNGARGGRDRNKRRFGLERPGSDDLGKGSSTTVRGGGHYMCPANRSWCSKDRVFATAVGTMILLADTPYRPAFLGTDPAAAGKAAARSGVVAD